MMDIISEDDSFNSSQVNILPGLGSNSFIYFQAHSEQITAPIHKKGSNMAKVNHSFSEPDLLKLFSKYRFVFCK